MAAQKEQILRMVLTEMAKEGLFYAPAGISLRHVHLSQKDLQVLFGPGYVLQPLRSLVQPGQYAAQEQVELEGPKGRLRKVRIIGPARSRTQVELSVTDALSLGMKEVPVRMSGDLSKTPGIRLIGPYGQVDLTEGVMIAARHLHLSPQQAKAFHVHDGQAVSVRVGTDRPCLLQNVICRIGDGHELEFHIDSDEANACLLKNGDIVQILPDGEVQGSGSVQEDVFDPVRISGKVVSALTGRKVCRTDRESLIHRPSRTPAGEEILDLVTEQDINLAAREGRDCVYRDAKALITPAAADRAASLKIRILSVKESREEAQPSPAYGGELLELLTASELNAAFRDDRKELYCTKDAIITPAALERIEETGIRIIRV